MIGRRRCASKHLSALFSVKPAEIHPSAPLQLSTISPHSGTFPFHSSTGAIGAGETGHTGTAGGPRTTLQLSFSPRASQIIPRNVIGRVEISREKLHAEYQTSDRNLIKSRPRPCFKWIPPPPPHPKQGSQWTSMAQIHVRSMLVELVFRGMLEEQGAEQMEERPSWQKKLGVRGKQPKKK